MYSSRTTHYIVLLLFLCFVKAQDFSPGPYGINYFDIAGPFTIEDLSVRQAGDLDDNRFIDLKDILLYTSYLDGEINFSDEDLAYIARMWLTIDQVAAMVPRDVKTVGQVEDRDRVEEVLAKLVEAGTLVAATTEVDSCTLFVPFKRRYGGGRAACLK